MNKKDLRTFDRLVDMMDSPYQMERIRGRLEFKQWSQRFTQDELTAAWELIRDKYKPQQSKANT